MTFEKRKALVTAYHQASAAADRIFNASMELEWGKQDIAELSLRSAWEVLDEATGAVRELLQTNDGCGGCEIEVYQYPSGSWGWRAVARNRQVLAASDETYITRRGALQALKRFISYMKLPRLKIVFKDDKGSMTGWQTLPRRVR